MNEPKKERNEKIVYMIDQKRMTLTAVAKFLEISRQRVQHIYTREKSKGV